ncbi:MAG: glycoside hydrolase family 3 [Propionibacteriaceae bacterium]|jgi:beta-N-acetylhexosaminidase|nr:glycoside hydrolase family 3 [Propionibacteriaceae bacterium]
MSVPRAAAVALAAALLAGCVEQAPRVDPTVVTAPVAMPTPTPAEPTVAERCAATVADLSQAEQIGQLLMMGISADLDSAEQKAIEKYSVGSVILMDQDGKSVKNVAKLVKKLAKLDAGILVAADQEGGQVQRLDGSGFAVIPSAKKQAKLSASELAEDAAAWGKDLAEAGVRLNLAPVADVVPDDLTERNMAIARLDRGYGSDPEQVSEKVAAFTAGMHAAGIAVAVKHFPGLGITTVHTDAAKKATDSVTTLEDAALRPFQDALPTTDAVMVSLATYTRIDSEMAVYSPLVIGWLRDNGFDKVVISDDLGAARAAQAVAAKQRAAKFVAAGGDLALTVDPATVSKMVSGLKAAAKDDSAFAARIAESATRVLILKESVGLEVCK